MLRYDNNLNGRYVLNLGSRKSLLFVQRMDVFCGISLFRVLESYYSLFLDNYEALVHSRFVLGAWCVRSSTLIYRLFVVGCRLCYLGLCSLVSGWFCGVTCAWLERWFGGDPVSEHRMTNLVFCWGGNMIWNG